MVTPRIESLHDSNRLVMRLSVKRRLGTHLRSFGPARILRCEAFVIFFTGTHFSERIRNCSCKISITPKFGNPQFETGLFLINHNSRNEDTTSPQQHKYKYNNKLITQYVPCYTNKDYSYQKTHVPKEAASSIFGRCCFYTDLRTNHP